MRHPLGTGTVNLPVNFRCEERAALGRFAFREDRSIGSLVRHLILRGAEIEAPKLARQIHAARRKRHGAVLISLILWSASQAILDPVAEPMRRPPTLVRVRLSGGWKEDV